MNGQEIRPGRGYYVLAVMVFVAGIGLFAWLLFKNLSGLSEGLKQVVVPGKTDLVLSKAGNYTVFYEYRSVVDNKVYLTERSLSGLACTLASKSTGSEIRLSRSTMTSTYTLGGREGVSILEFQISQPGTYEFSAGYAEGREGPEVVLAIGQDFTARLFATVIGSLAALFGSMALALVIFGVTLNKRSKAKKLLASGAASYRPIG